jgi:predicted DNA-binding antitoxin AbrB/MazE fold protein
MTTLKIKVSDKMLDKLLGMLKQFKTEDVQIVQEFETLDEEQNYVHESLAKLESGESRSFSIQELDERMKRIIKDYED